MDPNETLAELASLRSRLSGPAFYALDVTDLDRLTAVFHDIDRFMELFGALDAWMRRGGFLPAAWQAQRPTP